MKNAIELHFEKRSIQRFLSQELYSRFVPERNRSKPLTHSVNRQLLNV